MERNKIVDLTYIASFQSLHHRPVFDGLLASFPGSSAPEREIELVHACTIRVLELQYRSAFQSSNLIGWVRVY